MSSTGTGGATPPPSPSGGGLIGAALGALTALFNTAKAWLAALFAMLLLYAMGVPFWLALNGLAALWLTRWFDGLFPGTRDRVSTWIGEAAKLMCFLAIGVIVRLIIGSAFGFTLEASTEAFKISGWMKGVVFGDAMKKPYLLFEVAFLGLWSWASINFVAKRHEPDFKNRFNGAARGLLGLAGLILVIGLVRGLLPGAAGALDPFFDIDAKLRHSIETSDAARSAKTESGQIKTEKEMREAMEASQAARIEYLWGEVAAIKAAARCPNDPSQSCLTTEQAEEIQRVTFDMVQQQSHETGESIVRLDRGLALTGIEVATGDQLYVLDTSADSARIFDAEGVSVFILVQNFFTRAPLGWILGLVVVCLLGVLAFGVGFGMKGLKGGVIGGLIALALFSLFSVAVPDHYANRAFTGPEGVWDLTCSNALESARRKGMASGDPACPMPAEPVGKLLICVIPDGEPVTHRKAENCQAVGKTQMVGSGAPGKILDVDIGYERADDGSLFTDRFDNPVPRTGQIVLRVNHWTEMDPDQDGVFRAALVRATPNGD